MAGKVGREGVSLWLSLLCWIQAGTGWVLNGVVGLVGE
jgi:hypothetical protein